MNQKLRNDFPLLDRKLDGRPVVYLDSAATSLKPRAVLQAEAAYATQFSANVHRGKHALSEEASAAFESARMRIARFIDTDPDCVVFVKNTTEAINMIAAGLSWTPEDVVVVAGTEHHSNLVPWMKRARLVVCECDVGKSVSIAAVDALLTQHRPKILALGYACNVTGVIHPIRALCALARARGVMTVVDAAQAIPHIPVSVHELGCDFLAFSAHKMLGPTGLGILAARRDALESLDPLLVGGGTVERVTSTGYTLKKIPHRFEAGTPHISGVLGLAAAIDYLEQLGFDAIIDHERKLAAAIARVLSRIPHLRIFMATEHPRLAVASFAVCGERVTPDHLARVLSDSYQIMVRSGFHCAHPFFDRHAAPQGALRISAYLYNTEAEIEHFGEVLMVLVQRLVGA